jgi:hypothetical protein
MRRAIDPELQDANWNMVAIWAERLADWARNLWPLSANWNSRSGDIAQGELSLQERVVPCTST